MLTAIKILHMAVWALMAGSLALPINAIMRRFRWSAALTCLILLECAVLAFNGLPVSTDRSGSTGMGVQVPSSASAFQLLRGFGFVQRSHKRTWRFSQGT
jgi:hypothetical protein